MRIGVVNQTASVGGWRYLGMLLDGIKQISPNIEITLYVNSFETSEELISLERRGLRVKKIKYGLSGSFLHFHSRIFFGRAFIDKPLNFLRKLVFKYRNRKALAERLSLSKEFDDMDVIFYSWPYGIDPVETKAQIFYIPHDFIVSHGFGLDGVGFYYRDFWKATKENLQKFVNRNARPIVSSNFIKDEYRRVFPMANHLPKVIYLAKFNNYKRIESDLVKDKLRDIGVIGDYVLFANNNMPHKNLAQAIGAMYYVKQKYPDLKLIVSDHGNNNICGVVHSPFYMDHCDENDNWDVKGLGLVSNDTFAALLQGAKVVLNCSLCEAGAGSALDAWSMGTPVVLSKIPAFEEQVKFLGTEAVFVDPRNSKDIALGILKIIDNPSLASSMALKSREAMGNYGWGEVAEQYLDAFEEAINENRD